MTTRLYARVSTTDKGQDPEVQLRLLRQANGHDIVEYVEHASAAGKRPVFDRMLREAAPGDVIMVWKIDRFARSVLDAYTLLRDLTARGVAVRSLTEGFETATPMGKAMFGMLAVFAELERDHIRERVKAGIARSKANGVQWGWRRGRKRLGVRGKALDRS